MKITPISEGQIKLDTGKSVFRIYAITSGGIEIQSSVGKALHVIESPLHVTINERIK